MSHEQVMDLPLTTITNEEFRQKYPGVYEIAEKNTGRADACQCKQCTAWREMKREMRTDPPPSALALMEERGPAAVRDGIDKVANDKSLMRGLAELAKIVIKDLKLSDDKEVTTKLIGSSIMIPNISTIPVTLKFDPVTLKFDDGEVIQPSVAEPATSTEDTTTDTEGEDTMNTATVDVMENDDENRDTKKGPMSGKWKEVGISRDGDRIVLPVGMTSNEAIEWIKRRRDEEDRVVAIREEIEGYPLDAGIAVVKALQETRGFVSLAATPGFFGSRPPMMVTVETGIGKTTQVPWGRIEIPGIEGFLQTGLDRKDGRLILVVGGEVKQKHREEVAEIMNVARRILKAESIYKGKAIRVRFPDEDEQISPSHAPKFIDVTTVKEDELVFPANVQAQVVTSIFTPIEHTAKVRAARIPLKRGILLEGPYGVGKTLTAYVTAKKCEENGWTFIYLDTVADLEQAIMFAKAYQPACIFAEDIDRVVTGERDVDMDAILNTIDGIDTKASDLMVILTTNHVENINRAMLRPGRLDAVVSVRAPDAKAAERLVRQYGGGLIADAEDLTSVGEKLKGQIPAVIREVVERSKLAAVAHQAVAGTPLEVKAADLVVASESMLAHLALLAEKPSADTPGVAMAKAFADRFAKIIGHPTGLLNPDVIAEATGLNGKHSTT